MRSWGRGETTSPDWGHPGQSPGGGPCQPHQGEKKVHHPFLSICPPSLSPVRLALRLGPGPLLRANLEVSGSRECWGCVMSPLALKQMQGTGQHQGDVTGLVFERVGLV